MDLGSRATHPGGRTPADLLRGIAEDAFKACDAGRAVARAVVGSAGSVTLAGRPLRASGAGRLLVLAVGKAAAAMHDGLAQRLRAVGLRRPVRSLVIAPRPEPDRTGRSGRAARPAAPAPRGGPRIDATLLAGDHPVPGAASFRAGKAAWRFMASARAGDDVVALVSGGGSSLMAAPLTPFVSPAEMTRLNQVLVVSGAPIAAVNTVRKHLSAIKGGRLAILARRARSLTTLVVCDVDPERYEEVSSGPTTPDRTTLDDLVAAVARYGLATAMPDRVLDALRAGRLPETPKPQDAAFRKARAQMLLSNVDLRNAAVRAGLSRGLAAEAMPTEIVGPVDGAVEMVARAIEGAPTGLRLLVLGGEALTIPAAPGIGGRAQEFALRLALRMRNLSVRGWAFLAAGSDGRDGSSPAAGAYVDASTLERAAALGLDADRTLARAETYRFFARLGDALTTGPTNTNVRDVYLLLTGLPRLPQAPAASTGTPGQAASARPAAAPPGAPRRNAGRKSGGTRRSPHHRPARRR